MGAPFLGETWSQDLRISGISGLEGVHKAGCAAVSIATWLLEFVQSKLNRGIHRHVEKYGCYANRDVCKLVREAGLHIALEQRSHFGTTYSLVCTKSPLVKEESE